MPRRSKVALALLVPYLASPIDLIPDFIPGLGQLDDALLVAVALRYVIRRAGPDVITELWPGGTTTSEVTTSTPSRIGSQVQPDEAVTAE